MAVDVDRAKFNQEGGRDPIDRTPEEQERRKALSMAQSAARVQERMTAAGIAPGKYAHAKSSRMQYLDQRGNAIDPKDRMGEALARTDAEIARKKGLFTTEAAAAKKKKEKEMRLIVRPMQKALWTTGTIGAETVILPILAYPLWFLWKLAEIRKTRTKQDIGLPVWEDFIAPFGPIDYLQVIIGAVATLFIGLIIMGAITLVIYFFLDPVEFMKSFNFLAEAFQFLFE